MSANQDAVLELDESEGEGPFSGFSTVPSSEEDLPDKRKKKGKKLKSVVKTTVNKSVEKNSEKNASPKKSKPSKPSKPKPSSSKASKSVDKQIPDMGIDLNKLSTQDIENLRSVLGINTNTTDIDSDYEQYKENRQNLRVQVNSRDLSEDEQDYYVMDTQYDLSRDLSNALFNSKDNESVTDNMEDDMWALPKLKVPLKGKPIAKSLADMVNRSCASQCDIENVSSKYKVPENCENVSPPLVNNEIWKIMDKRTQSNDRGIVDIQNLVATGLSSTMKLAELMKKQISENNEAKTLIADSIVILGQVQFFLSVKRRYMIRPSLKKKYQGLCNINMPITSKLFGEDVTKDIKTCDSMTFLGRDSYNPRGRGNSYTKFGRKSNQQYGNNWRGNRYNPYYGRGQGRGGRSNFSGYKIPKRPASATVSSAPNE